jgi:hypothetical protein
MQKMEDAADAAKGKQKPKEDIGVEELRLRLREKLSAFKGKRNQVSVPFIFFPSSSDRLQSKDGPKRKRDKTESGNVKSKSIKMPKPKPTKAQKLETEAQTQETQKNENMLIDQSATVSKQETIQVSRSRVTSRVFSSFSRRTEINKDHWRRSMKVRMLLLTIFCLPILKHRLVMTIKRRRKRESLHARIHVGSRVVKSARYNSMVDLFQWS